MKILGAALLVGMMLLPVPSLAQEQVTDLKLLAGNYVGSGSGPRGRAPFDLSVREDGSYTVTVQGEGRRTFTGQLQLIDGKIRFRNSDGATGTWTVSESKGGKRVIKTVRDDGMGSSEAESR